MTLTATLDASEPIQAFRQAARALTAALGEVANATDAQSVSSFAVSCYWSFLTCGEPVAESSCKYIPIRAHARELAEEVAAAAIDLPPEVAEYLLSSLYTSMLPQDVRAEFGVFFTPPPLVARLLDLAEAAGADWNTARVIDPAAGGGAFLAPAARRVAAQLASAGHSSGDILTHIEQHVAGVEIDEHSAWMSQVFSELAVWEHCIASRRRLKPLVQACDAFTLPDLWSGGADVVLGNPPYGRTTPGPEVRRRFERSLFGHANLYGMFMDLAVRLARPGGVIAFVTPAGFLGGQYFSNLRQTLRHHAPPAAVDFVADRMGVFDGVLQETVLITCRVGAVSSDVNVHINRPDALTGGCEVETLGTFPLPKDARAPWVLPRTADQAPLLRRAAALPHTLADYAVKISTGPLVWNRHKSQLRDHAGSDTFPLVWAESVLSNGEFRYSAERRNHSPYFAPEDHQNYLVIDTPCVLVQRTTAKEQRRRIMAAMMPASFLNEHGGAVVENHLNMVRANGRTPLVTLEAIAALLNSDIADRLFRCINGSVAVSAYELASLPVPAPDRMRAVEQATAAGASKERIEQLITEAYGI